MRANTIENTDRWFWSRVDKSGECWLWTGAAWRSGYGAVKFNGRQVSAHRFAAGLPDGDVLHRCGTRLCVRPDHLYVGDAKQNATDREAHGRTARNHGEHNGQSKLTQAAVDDIRRGGPARELAEKYGVNVTHIYRVRRGERW